MFLTWRHKQHQLSVNKASSHVVTCALLLYWLLLKIRLDEINLSLLSCSIFAPSSLLSVSLSACVRDEARVERALMGALYSCSNVCTSKWSISLISCQPSAVCFCSSRNEYCWKSRVCFKYRLYMLKDICSLPTFLLHLTNWCVPAFPLLAWMRRYPLFLTVRPLLVVQINTPSALTMMFQLLCFCYLCEAAWFNYYLRALEAGSKCLSQTSVDVSF